MKNMTVNGPFSHDLMATVLRELYPQLQCGRDFMTAHPIDEKTNAQGGEPFIAWWRTTDFAQPEFTDVKAEFEANEEKYRAIFARRVRDASLEWSDSKMAAMTDAPATFSTRADAWKLYRQALRDVPQQPGFPMDIDWPAIPE